MPPRVGNQENVDDAGFAPGLRWHAFHFEEVHGKQCTLSPQQWLMQLCSQLLLLLVLLLRQQWWLNFFPQLEAKRAMR